MTMSHLAIMILRPTAMIKDDHSQHQRTISPPPPKKSYPCYNNRITQCQDRLTCRLAPLETTLVNDMSNSALTFSV